MGAGVRGLYLLPCRAYRARVPANEQPILWNAGRLHFL